MSYDYQYIPREETIPDYLIEKSSTFDLLIAAALQTKGFSAHDYLVDPVAFRQNHPDPSEFWTEEEMAQLTLMMLALDSRGIR